MVRAIACGRAVAGGYCSPLLDSVVSIIVVKPVDPRPDPSGAVQAEARRATRALGSGFIVDAAGYIVTNRHVIDGGSKITVVLHDDRRFTARVVGANEQPDIALLKIEAPGPLPVVSWGASDALRLGETVIAIGNPLGLSTSVTVGVVSALNRNVSSTLIDDFIQSDVAINKGNSGGPLFNGAGQVVGVNSAIVMPGESSGSVGLSLAIPAETARIVLDHIRRFGRLRAGFPGVALQPLTPELAEVLGLPDTLGGLISEARPQDPAMQAGLREGDVMLQLDDLSRAETRAMMRQFADIAPGTVVRVRAWRDGREMTVSVPFGAFPPEYDPVGPPVGVDLGPRVVSPTLGLRLWPLDEATKRSLGIVQPRPGLFVEGAAANSLGTELGLGRGDLIMKVAGQDVATVEAFVAALARHRIGRGTVMQVLSRGNVRWIAVPVGDLGWGIEGGGLAGFCLEFGEDFWVAFVEVVEALAGFGDLGVAGFVVVDDAAVGAGFGGAFEGAFGAFAVQGFDQLGAVEMQAFVGGGGDLVEHAGFFGEQADGAAEEVGVAAVAQGFDEVGGVAGGCEVGEFDQVVVGEFEQAAVQLGLEAGA